MLWTKHGFFSNCSVWKQRACPAKKQSYTRDCDKGETSSRTVNPDANLQPNVVNKTPRSYLVPVAHALGTECYSSTEPGHAARALQSEVYRHASADAGRWDYQAIVA